MILQSEAQFLDNYGRKTEVQRRTYSHATEPDSLWDKLSRIFTFGCIEANHNRADGQV